MAELIDAEVDRSRLLRMMFRIRAFETKLLELFSEGKLFGTTHTCIGQEACAASLYASVDPQRDAVFTNHRCHGHFLAYGGSMRALMAEIMGRRGGVCGGRGGSQHLCEGRFFSQGIQGGGSRSPRDWPPEPNGRPAGASSSRTSATEPWAKGSFMKRPIWPLSNASRCSS